MHLYSQLEAHDTCRQTTAGGSLLEVSQKDSPIIERNSSGNGRVISVVFCIPYRVIFAGEETWKLGFRRGYSALFDSLSYLSSKQSPWNHTIVGWTGEIGILTSQTSPSARQGIKAVQAVPHADPQDSFHSVVYTDDLAISFSNRLALEARLRDYCGAHTIPVWLTDDIDSKIGVSKLKNQSRWRKYAEHELHTLFHYQQRDATDGRKEKLWWQDYCHMNQLFADRIEEIYEPGDIIWIHDYHLLLLPLILRERIPQASIGFFFHTSFPSSEYMRCLTKRKEVLEGVLGANFVGFQSTAFSRHFSSCCSRILRLDCSLTGIDTTVAQVAIDVTPIGINASSTHREAHHSSLVDDKIKALQELFANKRIIVGRDRLDTVRGVVQKLQAFEMFLHRYPEWRGEVVLIQITSPSNIAGENDHQVNKVLNKISELVSRINGTYGSLSFAPVQRYSQYLSRQEYFALLRVADVGLITSVRDGMNTTSMQYVICQKNNHGPLILSEFSGTSGSLSSALTVNPWNLQEVADCLHRALCMSSEERKAHHERLLRQVTNQTVQNWNDQFIRKLLSSVSSCKASNLTTPLDREKVLKRFQKAEKRVFMFDYDGTLTPIVKDPLAALPTARLIGAIRELAADSKNAVWIISGRDQAFLDEHLGHVRELGLSAEHGCFIRHPMNPSWESVTDSADMSWRAHVTEVFQHYTEQTPGSVVEQKKVALTWHYRNADPDYGKYQALQCRYALEDIVVKKFDVEVMAGKAHLEVRPRFVNKGEIAKLLIGCETKRLPSTAPEFVLCLGDDHTDEDMFRVLDESNLPQEDLFACIVGPNSKPTMAKWHLLEPNDVISIVEMLNQHGNQ